jgi:hypothetical protein
MDKNKITIDTAAKFTKIYIEKFHYFAGILGEKEAINGMFQNAISEAFKRAKPEETTTFLELLNQNNK